VFGSRDPNLYGQWHCHTLTKVGESFTAYSECSDDVFEVPILTLSLTLHMVKLALKLFVYQFPSSTSSGLELICKKLAIVWCSVVGSCYHWPLTNQKLLSLRSSYLLYSQNHAALNFPSFLQIKKLYKTVRESKHW